MEVTKAKVRRIPRRKNYLRSNSIRFWFWEETGSEGMEMIDRVLGGGGGGGDSKDLT